MLTRERDLLASDLGELPTMEGIMHGRVASLEAGTGSGGLVDDVACDPTDHTIRFCTE